MNLEQFDMEMAIRVAKWKTQLGELHVKEQALVYDLDPKIKELEDMRRQIKQHEGALSEAYAIQLFVEDDLRKQGKLGRDNKKHEGSVLDQAEKMEVRTLESSNNTGSWTKSGSVSL